MNFAAYIVSALTIVITIVLLTFTLIPLINKAIKITSNKKTKVWFGIIITTIILEIVAITGSIIGEASAFIIPAPGWIWLIFKISSLLLLWFWSYCYFFIWVQLQKNKKT